MRKPKLGSDRLRHVRGGHRCPHRGVKEPIRLPTGQLAARSREEVATAICALLPADWVRLRKTAQRYAAIRSMEPEDLLQEALVRAVDTRVCPAHVDVVRFLAEAIRSIAHGEGEKIENKVPLIPISKTGDMPDEAVEVPDPAQSAESKMISEEDAARIRSTVLSLFDDNPVARDVLEGTMENMTPEEICELTSISKTEYNSKRRLIRRRIDDAFPEGWKT